jgi:hypothetical protein
VLNAVINPVGVVDEYLHGLNRSFGHWGDRSVYRWAFERQVGAPAADLMVLHGESGPVAGSAVSYRRIRHTGGEMLAGIMTGSWTLPEARGRGAFAQAIQESRRLTAARGGAALLAFVTHDNASRRRLVAAGCAEVPTFYVASTDTTTAPDGAPPVHADEAGPAELFRAHERWVQEAPGAHVIYPSVAEWASQFLERALPVECVRVAGAHCLVERAAASDRVLWIAGPDPAAAVAALLARASGAGRQLFFFTCDQALAQAGAALNMVARPGSLTVISAGDDEAELPTGWRLQGGDRV